jgi:hypothetical protein
VNKSGSVIVSKKHGNVLAIMTHYPEKKKLLESGKYPELPERKQVCNKREHHHERHDISWQE